MVNHSAESASSYPHYPYSHSDSSRSSSVDSSSVSPSTVAPKSMSSTTLTVPRTASTTALGDIDPVLAQHVEYELGLTKRNGTAGSGTRKNAWGNLSYAELISKAITTSAEQRLTLSEIYDWMIKYVPFFRNKVDRASSAGWKNSIRHNLSLHNRFKRIQGEGTGKSSWWVINPDDKIHVSPNNGHSSTIRHVVKSGRRRTRQASKSPTLSPGNASKRIRTMRSFKSIRSSTSLQRQTHESSLVRELSPLEMTTKPVYDSHSWANRMESDNSGNHLYEQDFYSTSIHTPPTTSNANSIGGMPSNYSFDDGMQSYPSNSSSSTTNNNSSTDFSYNHFSHHHEPLYQLNNNNYYPTQPIIHDHSTNMNNSVSFTIPSQQQQLLIDPNDDQQVFFRANSRSSQSSSSPTSSSSNYSYSQKNSSITNTYHHPSNLTGPLTLYSHHHQYHHSNLENMLHVNYDDDGNDVDDDEYDLSTLVHHHHGMIDDHQNLTNVLPGSHHSFHSHQDSSSSLLRTVLQRSTIGHTNHPL